jgi:hypothetical protein
MNNRDVGETTNPYCAPLSCSYFISVYLVLPFQGAHGAPLFVTDLDSNCYAVLQLRDLFATYY